MIAREPVVIMGAGGVGLMALLLVKAMGGKGAVMVDIDPVKRAAALRAGALAAIDGRAPDAAKDIIAATGGGAAAVVDFARRHQHRELSNQCTGSPRPARS